MASARRYVNNIFLFEIIFNFASGLMLPNYYIDISKYVERKTKALRFHKTEYDKYGEEKWINSIDETFKTLEEIKGTELEQNYLISGIRLTRGSRNQLQFLGCQMQIKILTNTTSRQDMIAMM